MGFCFHILINPIDYVMKSPKGQVIEDPKSIGISGFPEYQKNVKTFLIKEGKSINDLAKHLKMTHQGVYQHIKTENPNLFLVRLIAEYFEVTVGTLLGNESINHFVRDEKDYNFFLLKNRLKLIAERRNYTMQFLATKLKVTESQFLSWLEQLELIDNPSAEDHEMLTVLAEILRINLSHFFFTTDGALLHQYGSLEKIQPESEGGEFMPKFSFNDLADHIKSKQKVVDEIINHFLRCYPENDVSYFLTHGPGWESIKYNSLLHKELRDKIKRQESDMGLDK